MRNLLAFPQPPSQPLQQGQGQPDRQVPDDPREAWQLWFPRNLTVQQVITILRASRMGDQWQLASLVEVMLDSWPMLKKCQHELRSAVSQTNFSIHPFAVKGKEPTTRAKEKADLVEKAMTSFRPRPDVTDEWGFQGMVYDLTNAYLIGMTLVEMQWYTDKGDLLPRASTFCHPAHIVLNDAACINIANSRTGSTIPCNPDFFLTSVYQSQSGSVYSMGMVRSVGWWWAAMLAAQQWMFGGAQRYGAPYTFLTYARALMGNTVELDKIEASLQSSGANRYIMAPEGTTADLKPPGSLGPENPQRYIKEQADREVMQLFLGQTSSTQGEAGSLGGNGEQHMEVRAERREAVSRWIGNVLSEQFAPAILRRNYGEDSECPKVLPDFTETESRLEAAQRVAVEINTGLPFVAEEMYQDLNRTVPEAGDMTVQRGTLGVMSDPAETPIQPTLEEQVEQQSMIAEASGQFEEPGAVAARAVMATGTSEGAKKGWALRSIAHIAETRALRLSETAHTQGTSHREAAKAHREAAEAHTQLASHMEDFQGREFHKGQSRKHTAFAEMEDRLVWKDKTTDAEVKANSPNLSKKKATWIHLKLSL